LLSFNVIARHTNSLRAIGHLTVEIEDNPFRWRNGSARAYVSTVRVSRGSRNKGLGKALYASAITFYGELNTRFEDASTSAQRVWLSLIASRKYNFDWQEGTYLRVWPKGRSKNTHKKILKDKKSRK
jgi:GNAT superfamily N-acetyltransferase